METETQITRRAHAPSLKLSLTHAMFPSLIVGTVAERNLALGGKAVQSTTNSGLGVAQNAIDGNRQSIHALGSCSVTNGDKDPWWRVDLLDVYRVTRVSITNRGDCCEKRIEGIQIRIGNSLENNGNNNQAATVGPIPLGDTKTFEFKPVSGRYINLIVPGRNEYLTLCEVEVYRIFAPCKSAYRY
uniref:Fucolectin tachylectin-4 pentraxin-1 domain-containing protein n=1 Tax=Cyprinus carpio TaxID=7962 RepID=A0A8C1P232_CYPCA